MFGIKNFPAYAVDYKFFVVRYIDGDFWFYGAYNNGFKASWIALEINGNVISNENI